MIFKPYEMSILKLIYFKCIEFLKKNKIIFHRMDLVLLEKHSRMFFGSLFHEIFESEVEVLFCYGIA